MGKREASELVATTHRPRDYAGLLIHRGNGHIAEIEAALREVDFIDSKSNNDPKLVSRLVPLELQRNANAWLVLYSPQDSSVDGEVHDVLVIPFSDRDNRDIRASGNDLGALGLHAFRLLEKIRGDIRFEWTPVVGVAKLMERPLVPEEKAPRFQLIHSDAGLFEVDPRTGVALPSSANTANAHKDTARIHRAFREALRDVNALHAQRGTLQLDESDPSTAEQHTESLAGPLAEINNRLAERIVKSGAKQVTPPIVTQYEDIMDEDTKHYLISAATVAEYVKANPEVARDFEYSLPGSGVCKALEREVKGCIARYLSKQPRNITLWEVENALKTSSVVADGLRSDVDATLHAYLVGQKTTDLPEELKEIRKKRNQVAHIDPVSATEFDTLWRLCLDPESSPGESTLGKILEWKRQQAHSNVE